MPGIHAASTHIAFDVRADHPRLLSSPRAHTYTISHAVVLQGHWHVELTDLARLLGFADCPQSSAVAEFLIDVTGEAGTPAGRCV